MVEEPPAIAGGIAACMQAASLREEADGNEAGREQEEGVRHTHTPAGTAAGAEGASEGAHGVEDGGGAGKHENGRGHQEDAGSDLQGAVEANGAGVDAGEVTIDLE
jgi:hypothetical protein